MKGLSVSFCVLLAACSGDPSPDDKDTGTPDTGTDTGDTQPVVSCPEPTSGPTIHDTVIEADEVWRADEGPHLVAQWVTVRSGATLTVEPCVTVEFAAGKGISVAYPTSPNTGSLVAEGTAEQPIVFRGQDGARWGHLYFAAGATGRLAHVTLEGGGSDDLTGATLLVQGDSTFPTKRDLLVDTVTIRDSLGVGVHIDRLAGFADGSQDLVVTESGSDEFPWAMYIDEHAIDTLPRGTYTGNTRDAIFVDPTSHLEEDSLVKNLGVPYVVGTFAADSLVIGGGSQSPLVTMTVEPGVRMEFYPGTALEIEHYTGPFEASGALVAEGTAEQPIVFTSASEPPAPGDWQGLAFGGIARDDNSLKHVHIEYTGADCGCIYSTCSAIDAFEGAVIFSQQPPRAFVEDSVIRHGSSHGVVLGYLGTTVDFKEGLTFDDLAGCPQTLPALNECPDPRPACE
jgi:hypothetical protein